MNKRLHVPPAAAQYYLERMQRKWSVYQNVDALFFSNTGILRNEFTITKDMNDHLQKNALRLWKKLKPVKLFILR